MPVAGVLFSLGKFRDRPPCEPSRESSARMGSRRSPRDGDPAPAFPALYRKSSVPYYSNWCSPSPSRGEHRHCQILSPRLSGAFVVPGQVAVLLVALRNGEPCPALSNWCFALIPLAGLRPELARWLQRAAVDPIPDLWVLERINLLAVQAFKGGNLLVLRR